jgi:hypothetical protein
MEPSQKTDWGQEIIFLAGFDIRIVFGGARQQLLSHSSRIARNPTTFQRHQRRNDWKTDPWGATLVPLAGRLYCRDFHIGLDDAATLIRF